MLVALSSVASPWLRAFMWGGGMDKSLPLSRCSLASLVLLLSFAGSSLGDGEGMDAVAVNQGQASSSSLCGYDFDAQGVAVSSTIWGSSSACGACFKLTCDRGKSPSCLPKAPKVLVSVTGCSTCSSDSTNGTQTSFSLPPLLFSQLSRASPGSSIPITATPSSCNRTGGIAFTYSPTSTENFLSVLVSNVNGPGSVVAMDAKLGDKGKWLTMDRETGARWKLVGVHNKGLPVSFRISAGQDGPQTIEVLDAIPPWPSAGAKYVMNVNFG